MAFPKRDSENETSKSKEYRLSRDFIITDFKNKLPEDFWGTLTKAEYTSNELYNCVFEYYETKTSKDYIKEF